MSLLTPSQRFLVEQQLIQLSQANQEAFARLSTTPAVAARVPAAAAGRSSAHQLSPDLLLGPRPLSSNLSAAPSSSSLNTAAALLLARHAQGAAAAEVALSTAPSALGLGSMTAPSRTAAKPSIDALKLKVLRAEQELRERRRVLVRQLEGSDPNQDLQTLAMLKKAARTEMARRRASSKTASPSSQRSFDQLQRMASIKRKVAFLESTPPLRLSSYSPIRKRNTGAQQQQQKDKSKRKNKTRQFDPNPTNQQHMNVQVLYQKQDSFNSLPLKKRHRMH